MATTIDVLILMGSDSDAAVMSAAGEALTEFGLTWEMTVASAHRSPARVMRLIDEAPGRGVKVFIVGRAPPLIWLASSPRTRRCPSSACRSIHPR
jgi:phosphoribosylcarboxyaminoimidazole (NCAIR) mutase